MPESHNRAEVSNLTGKPVRPIAGRMTGLLLTLSLRLLRKDEGEEQAEE